MVPAQAEVARFASLSLASLIADRIFSFAFAVLMSAAFGTSASLDNYLLALSGPVLITTLLGDLIYSLLLPEVTKPTLEQHRADPRWNVVIWTGLVLVGLSVAYAGLWGIAVSVLSPKSGSNDLLLLGLLTSPLVFLGGIAALGATVLIAERAYFSAVIRIPLASLVTLASFLLWRQIIAGVEALAVSVVSGALAAALMMSVLVIRALGPLSLKMVPTDAGRLIRRLAGTSAAQLVAGLLGQGAIAVERVIGVAAGPGVVSALNYGRVLVSPPLLIGQSIATASFPRFVGQRSASDIRRHRDLGHTVGMVVFLLLPLSVLLARFAVPLVRAVYQRGTFDDVAVARTATTAAALALGLVPIAVCAVTTRFLYAERASARVAVLTGATLFLYCALAIALSQTFTYFGLAVASTISYVFLMTGQLLIVRYDRYQSWDHVPAGSISRSCAAALAMLLAIAVAETLSVPNSLAEGYFDAVAAASFGILAYFATAFVLRSAELRQSWTVVVRIARNLRGG